MGRQSARIVNYNTGQAVDSKDIIGQDTADMRWHHIDKVLYCDAQSNLTTWWEKLKAKGVLIEINSEYGICYGTNNLRRKHDKIIFSGHLGYGYYYLSNDFMEAHILKPIGNQNRPISGFDGNVYYSFRNSSGEYSFSSSNNLETWNGRVWDSGAPSWLTQMAQMIDGKIFSSSRYATRFSYYVWNGAFDAQAVTTDLLPCAVLAKIDDWFYTSRTNADDSNLTEIYKMNLVSELHIATIATDDYVNTFYDGNVYFAAYFRDENNKIGRKVLKIQPDGFITEYRIYPEKIGEVIYEPANSPVYPFKDRYLVTTAGGTNQKIIFIYDMQQRKQKTVDIEEYYGMSGLRTPAFAYSLFKEIHGELFLPCYVSVNPAAQQYKNFLAKIDFEEE